MTVSATIQNINFEGIKSGLLILTIARFFSNTKPIHGFYYGYLADVIRSVTFPIFRDLLTWPNSPPQTKHLAKFLNFSFSVLASSQICIWLGAPVSLKTALYFQCIELLFIRVVNKLNEVFPGQNPLAIDS